MSNQLGFPQFQGLPWASGPPAVDGYIEPDPGLPLTGPSALLEAGYVGGSRYTFANTSGAEAAGAPVVAFQGVRDASHDLLYLGWLVRFDFAFSSANRIVCCLRDAAGTTEMRIDLQPITDGGAMETSTPDANDLMGPPITIRTNKPPAFNPVFYTQAAGGVNQWSTVPDGTVKNYDIGVRSSEIGGGGSSVTALYWSVELQIPTSKATGGNWIDLEPNFGLYFNVIQTCPQGSAGCPGLVLNGYYCAQSAWPDPTFLITDDLSGLQSRWSIPERYYGEGIIVTPGADDPAKGVHFRKGIITAPEGIGIRTGPNDNDPLTTDLTITQGVTNIMCGRVYNDDTVTAPAVTAEFRIADFGIGAYGNKALWDKINTNVNLGGGNNPSNAVDIPANAAQNKDLTTNWVISLADVTKYTPLSRDQCLWVLLDSASGASIVDSSIRQNLWLTVTSQADHPLTVSGRGHGTPAGGAPNHDFILHVVDVKYQIEEQVPDIAREGHLAAGENYPAPSQLNLEATITGEVGATPGRVVFLHSINAYRCTGKRITIDKTHYTIWVHAGNCAVIATHDLTEGETWDDTNFAWQFTGGGIRRRGDGTYHLQVPYNADVPLHITVAAGGDVKPGDPTPVDPTPLGPPVPPTLEPGSMGEGVRQLQFLLAVEGYGLKPAQIDGNYGPTTTAAVRAFQQHNGVAVDGVVGPITWGALFALDPVQTVPFPTPVAPNATGVAVAHLQETLNPAARWFARWLPALAIDGVYGPNSQAFVNAARVWASLPANGQAGYQLWAIGAGPTLWDQAGVHAPRVTVPIPPTVRQGSQGEPAQQAQFLLSAEGYGLAPAQVDGNFGPVTVAAVRRFEQAHHLAVDGVVGPAVWKALLAGAPVAGHPFPPTLQAGASGPIVRLLQQTLNAARSRFGVTQPPLAVDGQYGPNTVALVRAFQAWGSVIIDGIVGYRTWSVAIGPSLWGL